MRSSASRLLERFPVDDVKVARTFVDGLGTEPEYSAIVRAIVAVADGLEIGVTALGVETHDQLASLEKLHCGRAQGSYVARPIPAEDLTQLVRELRRWRVD